MRKCWQYMDRSLFHDQFLITKKYYTDLLTPPLPHFTFHISYFLFLIQ